MISICLSIALVIAVFEIAIVRLESKQQSFDLALALGRSTAVLIGISIRLVTFPFICLLILISLLRHWIILSIDYLLTGGELIIYNNAMDKRSIRNYLDELIKKQSNNGKEI